MVSINSLQKLLAVLLLLVLFGARLSAVSYSGFVVPLQDYIAKTDVMVDANAKPKMTHFKSPISSVDVPVPCTGFVLVEMVLETPAEFPPSIEKDLPEGHVTIFIPPA